MLWFGIDRKWWTLLVVGVGTFMSAVDGSVVNTALPIIQSETGAIFSTLEWVVLVYLLTIISLLLVVGRLGDMYGRKRFYLSGFLIFTVGSLMCGLSPSVHALIVFRAIQATGAAMIFALAPAVLTGAFPKRQRGQALGMQATLTYLGLSVGPALGGLLTHNFGWRSIFFINLPIGMIIIPLGYLVLKRDVQRSSATLDPIGAITLAVALSTLLLALTKVQVMGWSDPVIITMFVISAAAFAVFIVAEMRIVHPMLDLKLFKNRMFGASTAAAFLNYVANSSVTFLMPFYLIDAGHYRVDKAGLLLTATSIAMAIVAAPAGWLSDRIGVRIPATSGMSVVVLGMLLLRQLQPGSQSLAVVIHLALIGIGIGFFTSPNNSAIMGSAPEHAQGVAGALLAAARNTGFAVGTAIAGLLYAQKLHTTQHLSKAVSVTNSMHYATTIVAAIAAVGIITSAVRGAVEPPTHPHLATSKK
ncbi:MAG: MFS transporter [Armatimonadota bacterium]|jgi:EmrB/QacA subfamily drug resistance transporter